MSRGGLFLSQQLKYEAGAGGTVRPSPGNAVTTGNDGI